MNKFFLKKLVLLSILILIAFTSCKKDENIDTQSVEDNARGSLVVADAFAFSNSTATKKMLAVGECYTVITNSNYFEITFDSCDYNGIYRNGTLKVTLSDNWASGSLMSIEFENFVFDGNKINGKIDAEYSIDLINGIYFKITAENMVMNFNNGESFSWNSNLNFSFNISGLIPVFEIYGYSSGINRYGEEFETNMEGILFDSSCTWPTTGTFTITSGGTESVVYFDEDGSSACNNILKVTQGRESINITLEPSN